MFKSIVSLLVLTHCVQAASQIALFTDQNCKVSLKGLEGPNGYPNGSCTDFRMSGEYGSLQVVGLDPGCAVTIYMNDPNTTICGGFQREIQLGDCYNATWAYYSIDMCDIGAARNTPFPSSSPSSDPSSDSSNKSATNTGAIVGGVVGGVIGLGLLVCLAVWLFLQQKNKKNKQIGATNQQDVNELRAGPVEMHTGVYENRHEMYDGREEGREGGGGGGQGIMYKKSSHSHAVEVVQPPVELAGREVGLGLGLEVGNEKVEESKR